MSYRNKVFVSFDGDNDIHYYRLMRAWKQNDGSNFNFYDAHDINTARDTSLESTIKARLRERLSNSKILVCLIGQNTRYLYKFLRWELEQALSLEIPIIGVNLNGKLWQDLDRCPPIIRDELVVYNSFNSKIMQHALEQWPLEYHRLKRDLVSGPRYYPNDVYVNLGL